MTIRGVSVGGIGVRVGVADKLGEGVVVEVHVGDGVINALAVCVAAIAVSTMIPMDSSIERVGVAGASPAHEFIRNTAVSRTPVIRFKLHHERWCSDTQTSASMGASSGFRIACKYLNFIFGNLELNSRHYEPPPHDFNSLVYFDPVQRTGGMVLMILCNQRGDVFLEHRHADLARPHQADGARAVDHIGVGEGRVADGSQG